MAVIKVKRPNGEEHTFNLTDNSKDTGGNYIRVRFNDQDLYARVSGNVTPLNVVKSNGDRGYVQYDPIGFNTWKWEAWHVEKFNRWYVYLPKGKYRVTITAMTEKAYELTIPTSKDIEITITTYRNNNNDDFITFNIDNQISRKAFIDKGIKRLVIERTGNI
ncbi:MAG: hypothetical protein D8B58_09910 [Veillonella sp.]|nr:MAG: hypothetical protein D8B58_09910 [Veillonella sp.]